MAQCTVVGIAGGSGSGKSTLVERLLTGQIADKISYLPHDAYYHDVTRMPETLREAGNWDHPEALENSLYLQHIEALKQGQIVARPRYDFANHARVAETTIVEPRPILLVEGILLFAIPEVAARIDLRIYIDTPAEERLARRVLRDNCQRGRNVESILDQFRSTVRPMHDQYVEPSRAHAHLIIPWDWQGDHQPALDVLNSWLQSRI
jgi:uridine kinase